MVVTMNPPPAKPDSTTTAPPLFTVHDSISDEIIQKYDGFILDQFGVMHNGTSGLPGAPACVQALQDQGKKIIILSNSSALSVSTMAKLPKLGFDPDHFVGAVTSGQEASQFIRETYGSGSSSGNTKALFFTWRTPSTPSSPSAGPDNKTPLLPSPAAVFWKECCRGEEGAGDAGGVMTPVAVEDVETADVIILHGCDVVRGPGADGQAVETDLGAFSSSSSSSSSAYPSDQADVSSVPLVMAGVDFILKRCAAKAIPMVCANPDFICIRPDGSIANMPGQIAARYEAMGGGGVVTSFGKPHQEHFEACVRELGLPKEKVVHIGDSLHHDIAGANAAGIDSILVTGGVHCEELECALDEVPGEEALKALFAQHGETPTYVVPMLKL